MSDSILSKPWFHNEEAAYEFVESRLWPQGPVCPHCGGVERISKMQGKSTRIGAYKCYQCRKPFSVKVGTIFESSHIPMRIWLQAIFLLSSSKKGISSNQLHRTLGITLKSAWFLSHRIRETMTNDSISQMGGLGKIIEADETFIGNKKGSEKRRGFSHKNAVLTLVERGGISRSFHVDGTKARDILPIIAANVAKGTQIMTDDGRHYKDLKKSFPIHASVNHTAGEYVRGNVHSNTVENFFSVFKRGMKGVYQHCGEQHLGRYLTEYDFRYSNRKALGIDDFERAEILLKGVVGKRLTYQTSH